MGYLTKVRRRLALGGCGAAAAVAVLLPVAITVAIVAPRHTRPQSAPSVWGLTGRSVRVPGAGGVSLAGWIVPAQPGPPRAVAVLLHGIDADRDSTAPLAALLCRSGYACLLYDARARGESSGSACTLGRMETEDALSAIAWVRRQPEAAGAPVVLLGQSLGGATALMAAARDPGVAAVVAESAFSRLDRAAANDLRASLGPAGSLIARPVTWVGERVLGFPVTAVAPEASIRAIAPRPVLLIHDADDRIAPLSEAQRLLAASHGCARLWTAPNAAHVGAQATDPAGFAREVVGFLDAAARAERGEVPPRRAANDTPRTAPRRRPR